MCQRPSALSSCYLLHKSLPTAIRIRDSGEVTQTKSPEAARYMPKNGALLGFIPVFKILGNWMALLLMKFHITLLLHCLAPTSPLLGRTLAPAALCSTKSSIQVPNHPAPICCSLLQMLRNSSTAVLRIIHFRSQDLIFHTSKSIKPEVPNPILLPKPLWAAALYCRLSCYRQGSGCFTCTTMELVK